MEQKVIELFKKLNIPYEIIKHHALYSAKDNIEKTIDFKDAKCCKNLLLIEAKTSKLFLYSLVIEKRANLKEISNRLNLNRLSFANEEILEESLGIKSGNASILNIIEKPNTSVTFLIDKDLLRYNKVAFHPNVNTMSILFKPKYIEKILKNYDAKYMYIDV